MNSIIEAHTEFVENYNQDTSGVWGNLMMDHRKVTKIRPEVALYCFPNYKKQRLTVEDRLLFLLQDKFGMDKTDLIKKIIPDILELADPDYYEPMEYKEQAIEREPDKLLVGLFDSLLNVDLNQTTYVFHEREAIKK